MISSRLIVITDLDGTLLDHYTYSFEASLPAVHRLKSLHIPLILCSSKTHGEVWALWRELGLNGPFIVENGGAIYWPVGTFAFPIDGVQCRGGMELVEFGTAVAILRDELRKAARQCGVRTRSFGEMELEEIARLTGLGRDRAALAAERQYDEPFVVEAGEAEKLFAALRSRGLEVTRGGRFFHLIGRHDKGRAVKTLLDLYRRSDPAICSVGLGDAANDLALLAQVDRPILVRKYDGSWDQEVLKAIPAIERSQRIGPEGWREAVEKVLKETA